MTALPGPVLRIDFEAEAKIDVSIDIVAFFSKMPAREQADYRTWDDNDFWERDRQGEPIPWDKPLAYLNAYLNEAAEVSAGNVRGWVRDHSELEPWDTPRVRGGKYWTEDNYGQLLAAVPWLAALDQVDELPEEERAEIEARIPGPNDVPLFAVEGAS